MNIIDKYNIDINNPLFINAFTHTSYTNEHREYESYERLEFLGDKVLDFIVSDYLYNNSHLYEGDMSKIRASNVCEDALSLHSLECNFDKYIKVGRGEELNGGKTKKTILADVFESFIGALYLTYGLDIVKEFIYDTVINSIKTNEKLFIDYKSKLQELVQTDKECLEYKLVKEEGPAHDKIFEIEVYVEGIMYGSGVGKSKKEAEQNAARSALNKMA